MFTALRLPLTRLHPGVSDEALFGGLDLSATLSAGRIVQERRVLEPVFALILTMAERTPPQLAARLALTLDQGRGHCLIGLDEGAEPDESAPPLP